MANNEFFCGFLQKTHKTHRTGVLECSGWSLLFRKCFLHPFRPILEVRKRLFGYRLAFCGFLWELLLIECSGWSHLSTKCFQHPFRPFWNWGKDFCGFLQELLLIECSGWSHLSQKCFLELRKVILSIDKPFKYYLGNVAGGGVL